MNHIILLGRLVRDPALRHTQSGTPVTAFTIAVDRAGTSGENKKTDFIDCVAWKGSGEAIAKYFRKGQRILAGGRLQLRDWTDGEGHKRRNAEVVIREWDFIERKNDAVPANTADYDDSGYSSQIAGSPFSDVDGYEDDGDLPF